jgi:hypothetical protein
VKQSRRLRHRPSAANSESSAEVTPDFCAKLGGVESEESHPMAYILPQTREFNISSPPDRQAFGVVDNQGRAVTEAFQCRAGKSLTNAEGLERRFKGQQEWTRLDGAWYYGGILYPHFGHFMTESVHRLRGYIEHAERYTGVIFLKTPQLGTFDYDPLDFPHVCDTLFDYFSLSKDDVFICDTPLEIESLTSVPQQSQLGIPISADYLNFLGQLQVRYVAKFMAEEDRPATPDRVFISRRRYLSAGRALGMRAVEEVYEENGYEVFEPERWPLTVQVTTVSQASNVACEAGSAIHLLDIMGKLNIDLTVLSRRGLDRTYWYNLYRPRVKRMIVFDAVFPIVDYTMTPHDRGHSLIHPQEIMAFMEREHIVFNRAKFLDRLRYHTSEDMQQMFLCLPRRQ